jgi:G patch domain/KOW motif-containing protein
MSAKRGKKRAAIVLDGLDSSHTTAAPAPAAPRAVALSSLSRDLGAVSATGAAVPRADAPRVIPLRQGVVARPREAAVAAHEAAASKAAAAAAARGGGASAGAAAQGPAIPLPDGDAAGGDDAVDPLVNLPDADPDCYVNVPVEGFGDAILRGMNWEPGKAFGRSEKPVAPFEFTSRPARLGLGAAPKRRDSDDNGGGDGKGGGDNGQSGNAHQRGSAAAAAKPPAAVAGPTGTFNTAGAGETAMLELGERVIFVARDGSGAERKGAVRALLGPLVVVTDDETGGNVRVPAGEVRRDMEAARAAAASLAAERAAAAAGAGNGAGADAGADAGAGGDGKGGGASGSGGKGSSVAKGWARPGLRVRVISKSIAGGRLYCKKGVITDVPGLGIVTLRMDDALGVADAVKERQIETIVPRGTGSAVTVLRGDARGRSGSIVERDSEGRRVAVQFSEDLDIAWYALDDVCAFQQGFSI